MNLAELKKIQILLICVIVGLIVFIILDAGRIDDYVQSRYCLTIKNKFLKRILFMRKTEESFAKESVAFVIIAYCFTLITVVTNIVDFFIPKLATVIALGVIAGLVLITTLVEATIRELKRKRFLIEIDMD